jgi:chaperonin GroES
MEVRVGDKVIYGKYSGQNVTIDGTEVVIIKVTDLYGKLA